LPTVIFFHHLPQLFLSFLSGLAALVADPLADVQEEVFAFFLRVIIIEGNCIPSVLLDTSEISIWTDHLLGHWVQPRLVSAFPAVLSQAHQGLVVELTDSAPEAAGVAVSSFFCFGFAFANDAKRPPDFCFDAAGFSDSFGGSLGRDGALEPASSLSLSFLSFDGSSFGEGCFAAAAGFDAAGFAGAAPVLR